MNGVPDKPAQTATRSPEFRLTCCLCRNPCPRRSDVYALDAEWRRRYPDMRGTLACRRCTFSNYWQCRTTTGELLPGHLPVHVDDDHFDSWNHIEGSGTHIGMVLAHPAAGVTQGAQQYLIHVAQRRKLHHDTAVRIYDALQHG